MGRIEYQNELGDVLREYARVCGCFTKEQAYMMLPEKHYTAIDKVLVAMLRNRSLFLQGERYYTINPKMQIDYDRLKCLWILLKHKGNSLPGTPEFYVTKSREPAKLAYVKNDVLYEIVPVQSDSAKDILFLDKRYEEQVSEYAENGLVQEYILVLSSVDIVDYLPEMKAPHIYAVVNDMPIEEMDYETKKLCNIDFYESN